MDKIDEIKTYLSLKNILKIRANDLTDNQIRDNNNELMSKLREIYMNDSENPLFQYIYCYLFMNYEKLNNSYISFSNNSFVIISRDILDDKVVYTLNRIKVIDDDNTPIKSDKSKVVYDRSSNKYLISKSTSYSTMQGMEMIRLDSEESSLLADMHLEELFEECKKLKNKSVLFRNYLDLLLLTEIDLTDEDKKITHYECDIDDIARLEKDKQVTLEEHADNYEFSLKSIRNRTMHGIYPQFTLRAISYYRYGDKFADMMSYAVDGKEIKINNDINEEINKNKMIDQELEEFIKNNNLEDPLEINNIMEDLENKKTK